MKSSVDEELVKNLKASKEILGHLYPILLDAKGNPIDGKHRLQVDKNWETRILPWAKTEEDCIIAKLHANNHRRTVSEEERRRDMNRLAEIQSEKGLPHHKMASALALKTGFSDDYVRELLDPTFKHQGMSTKAKARSKKVRVDPEVLKKQIRALSQHQFDNMIKELKLSVDLLKKWEQAYRPEQPLVSKEIRTVIRKLNKFIRQLESFRKS